MFKKVEYQIVGRYMNGTEVTGYHLYSIETGKTGRYSREQVILLAGKGQLTNCEGQIYKDKVLLRGINGTNLDQLPVQQENGDFRSSDDLIGRVKRGTEPGNAMTQLLIIRVLKDGRNVIGYTVRNAGGATKNIRKEDVVKLARAGKIGNARVQEYNGKLILRGVNCDLSKLDVAKVSGSEEQ